MIEGHDYVLMTGDGQEIIIGKDEPADIQQPPKIRLYLFTSIPHSNSTAVMHNIELTKDEFHDFLEQQNYMKERAWWFTGYDLDAKKPKVFGFGPGTNFVWECYDYDGE